MEVKLKRKEDLTLLYYRYKDSPVVAFFFIVLIVVIAILLIIKMVIPQLQNWFSIREEVSASRERIQTLSANKVFVESVSSSDIENNLKLVAASFPFEKDFPGVLNAISSSAVESGAILDDYSFEVGNLSTKSAELNKETSLSVQLQLQGTLDVLDSFLNEIYKRVPLSEVVSVEYNEGNAKVSIVFYYKILPGSLKVNYNKPLSSISPDDALFLQQLEEWRNDSMGVESPPASASDSGSLNVF